MRLKWLFDALLKVEWIKREQRLKTSLIFNLPLDNQVKVENRRKTNHLHMAFFLVLWSSQNTNPKKSKRYDGVVISKVVYLDSVDFVSASRYFMFKRALLCIPSHSVVSQQFSTIQKNDFWYYDSIISFNNLMMNILS